MTTFWLSAIRRRPGRSALTALGIGLATALVVTLLALSAGISTSASALAVESGVDLLATSANTSLNSVSFPPMVDAHRLASSIPSRDSNVLTASPWLISELTFANASMYAASNSTRSGGTWPVGWVPATSGAVGWIPTANMGLQTPGIVSGTGLTLPGDPHYAGGTYNGTPTHQIVVDQGLALVLGLKLGEIVWVSAAPVSNSSQLPSWFANASSFRVVGISQPFWLVPSALLAFFYLSELQQISGSARPTSDPASVMLIHLRDPTSSASDQAKLGAAFPHLTFFTLANILTAVQSSVDLYRTFGTLVGAVGVVVAFLLTSTILLMNVEEQRREYAVLRAVGFGRRYLGFVVVAQGLLLGAFGLAIGLLGGYAGAVALGNFLSGLVNGLPPGFSFVAFDATVIGSASVMVLLVALIASFVPAVQAMRLPVASELRAP